MIANEILSEASSTKVENTPINIGAVKSQINPYRTEFLALTVKCKKANIPIKIIDIRISSKKKGIWIKGKNKHTPANKYRVYFKYLNQYW